LLNVPFEDDIEENDQREKYDIKSLIAGQYDTVSRYFFLLKKMSSLIGINQRLSSRIT